MAISRSWLGAAVLAICGCVFFSAGCRTAPEIDPMAKATVEGEKPVAMRGDGHYFDGKVVATVTVSRGFSRDDKGNKDKGGKERERSGRKYHERNASNYDLEDAYPSAFEGADEAQQKELYQDMVRFYNARRAAGSPMPPVTIRLKLENQGSAPVEVEVLELNSDLGNFAVRPAKLKLDPAQLGEVDPMVSQLGVTSDDIPVKVVLRVAGKKETLIIPVKSVFTAKTLETK